MPDARDGQTRDAITGETWTEYRDRINRQNDEMCIPLVGIHCCVLSVRTKGQAHSKGCYNAKGVSR